MKKGQIFSGPMSPFEAFIVADTLLYQKLTNDQFLQTNDEHVASLRQAKPVRTPGLRILESNPRQREFQDHLFKVATAKWHSPSDAISEVGQILEGN